MSEPSKPPDDARPEGAPETASPPEDEQALLPDEREQIAANVDWFSRPTPLQKLRALEANLRLVARLRRMRPVPRGTGS